MKAAKNVIMSVLKGTIEGFIKPMCLNLDPASVNLCCFQLATTAQNQLMETSLMSI